MNYFSIFFGVAVHIYTFSFFERLLHVNLLERLTTSTKSEHLPLAASPKADSWQDLDCDHD